MKSVGKGIKRKGEMRVRNHKKAKGQARRRTITKKRTGKGKNEKGKNR